MILSNAKNTNILGVTNSDLFCLLKFVNPQFASTLRSGQFYFQHLDYFKQYIPDSEGVFDVHEGEAQSVYRLGPAELIFVHKIAKDTFEIPKNSLSGIPQIPRDAIPLRISEFTQKICLRNLTDWFIFSAVSIISKDLIFIKSHNSFDFYRLKKSFVDSLSSFNNRQPVLIPLYSQYDAKRVFDTKTLSYNKSLIAYMANQSILGYPVSYTNNLGDYNDFIKNGLYNCLFVKSPKYKSQNEYRFAFNVNDIQNTSCWDFKNQKLLIPQAFANNMVFLNSFNDLYNFHFKVLNVTAV